MGCVLGKSSSVVKNDDNSPKQKELMKKTSELRVARAISSKRHESFSKQRMENGEVKIGLIDKKANGSRRVSDVYFEKKSGVSEDVNHFPELRNVPRAMEGEQIAAGWPCWLVAVAGEAIRGWIPRRADTFEKLDKIGQGTYSSVYKGRDLLNNKVVALKKVRFDNMDPESVKFMAREILILRKLDHPNIIKLEALVTSKTSSSLYLVFEYMDHDLTGLASIPGVKFTEPQIKCYMQQLLSGLNHCHNNGILHRDIKGSNLLLDNNGILKIADFGLASHFDNSTKIPLTSRVVTLWYRPPELLLGATRYGVAVDLWSSGCILGELYAGKPIMPGRTEVEQLHKIFKLCGTPSEDYWRKSKLPHSAAFKPIQSYRRRIAETFKHLPDAALGLMERLLSIDPSDRGTASSALQNEFFTTKPIACDPSSLPKYPPSKEIDAKLREDEGRRQRALGAKGQKYENILKNSKALRAAPAPNAYADHRCNNLNPKSQSEMYNPNREEFTSGFPIDPPKPSRCSDGRDREQNPSGRVSYSGPLTARMGSQLPGRKKHDEHSDRSFVSSAHKLVSSHGEATMCNIRRQDRNHHSQMFLESGRQDRNHHSQMFLESGRKNAKEPVAVVAGEREKERKIHFSGPINNNVEDVLKEHDRRIQEMARRIRNEKARVRQQELSK